MWFKNILHLRIFMILATMFLPVKYNPCSCFKKIVQNVIELEQKNRLEI